MIHTGTTQTLTILRTADAGLYLSDEEGNQVLLPNKYVAPHHALGQPVEVFVYRDSEDRQIATTLVPRIELGGFAPLEVVAVSAVGAFADMGLEKDLLIPFAEQRERLEKGQRPVVYMGLDEQTDRLYGSTRLHRHLDNSAITMEEGEEVHLLFHAHSDLGWSAVVNSRHEGLLHTNDVHRPLKVGDRMKGFIKQVREDGKLDLVLQPPGYDHYNTANMALLMDYLQQHGGVIPLTDKSPPEAIKRLFGISKRAFKQAVGGLYKARKVKIDEHSITWVGKGSDTEG